MPFCSDRCNSSVFCFASFLQEEVKAIAKTNVSLRIVFFILFLFEGIV